MTDRTESEFRSIFATEIDSSYQQSPNNNSNYQQSPSTNQPVRLYTDLPLEFLFPQGTSSSALPITEQKIYLQLSLEFRIIQTRASSYEEGMRNWFLVLPERLQSYGLNMETWNRISYQGDQDQGLQEFLTKLVRKIFN